MRRALMGVLCWASACGGGVEPVVTDEEPRTVDVLPIAMRPIDERVPAVGTVRAAHEAVVAARLLGHVQTVEIRAGDVVASGQVLVTLDDRELRAETAAARAARDEAHSAVVAAEHGVDAARAALRLAEATHARFEALLAEESVSRQEYDEAEARRAAATSALAAAESSRTQAEARRARSEAALTRAEVALGHARVTAPMAGVVTDEAVDPGDLAAPGTPLVTLEALGAYRLEVAAPASLRATIGVGDSVPVVIDGVEDDTGLAATVAEIVPAVDALSRTFVVKLDLPEHPDVRSGLYGRALFAGGVREAILVPETSVTERGQLRFVTVAEEGRARRRLVTVGEAREDGFEVLSGLNPGELIVLDPSDLADGAPVRPREPAR